MDQRHAPEEFDKVTELQRKEILPYIRPLLRGAEQVALDFGCGPGRFTPDLADLIDGHAIGLDIIQSLLEIAPPDPRVEYRLMRPGRIDLPDASMDLVWACLVLGSINGAQLRKTVEGLNRVLKPGGLLCLIDNTSDRPDVDYYYYRPPEWYCNLFPAVKLTVLNEYQDIDQRISVMAGRKDETDH